MTDDATTSRGFCVLTHCSANRLHVAQGVSPSHRIFLLLQRSQAFDTDFLRGCHSLMADGENRAGPSPAGRDASSVSKQFIIESVKRTERAHDLACSCLMSRISFRVVVLPRNLSAQGRQRAAMMTRNEIKGRKGRRSRSECVLQSVYPGGD